MKINSSWFIIVLTFFTTSVVAQTKPAPKSPNSQAAPSVQREPRENLCRNAESLIEEDLKIIALETVFERNDDSALRATNYKLEINAAYQRIQIQQFHMQSLQCPAIQWTLSPSFYMSFAVDCYRAQSKGDSKFQCDKKNWIQKANKTEY
jgi:hypothetical protein